jgi:hypothetical protein
MGRLERNSAAIRRYLTEVLPKLEKSTVAPEEPPDRKHRGGSRPPWGRGGDEIVEANRAASLVLTPLLSEMRASGAGYKGASFSEILLAVGNHPGVTQTWREHSRTLEAALWQMCLLVARAAHIRWDAAEIRIGGEVLKRAGEPLELDRLVVVRPEDGQLEANQWKLAHNRDNNEKKTIRKEDSWRRMDAEIRAIMESEGCGVEEAVGRYRKSRDVSRAWCYEALAFCRAQREGDGEVA